MSQGHVATLEPFKDADAARAVARLPRVKPRSLLTAVVGWERARREAGQDLPGEFAEAYWAALCNPASRAFPVVLQHYTTYVDPKARSLVRAGDAQPLSLAPRIVIVGPQSAITQAPSETCIDVTAQYTGRGATEDRLSEASAPTGDAQSTMLHCASEHTQPVVGDELAELRAQVAALTASVAQLASIVAVQRGASA
jgi:hypothetical protein